jgi:hypothetical protein
MEGKARVYSEALVEANRKRGQEQDRVPKELVQFFRLVASPEPKLTRSRVATRKEVTRAGQQGSKASCWSRRTGLTAPRDP